MSALHVIVTGGRDYADEALVLHVLDGLRPARVSQGGASGADELARGYPVRAGHTYPADWNTYGKSAGHHRNAWMLGAEVALAKSVGARLVVVAFPGGTGTADCVRQARALGIEVIEPATRQGRLL